MIAVSEDLYASWEGSGHVVHVELMDPMIHSFPVKYISMVRYDMIQNNVSMNSDSET